MIMILQPVVNSTELLCRACELDSQTSELSWLLNFRRHVPKFEQLKIRKFKTNFRINMFLENDLKSI